MFARIVPLTAVPASGSVAAQTSSAIDISSWSNFTISAHSVSGSIAGTGSLYVTNIENSAHNPIAWQLLSSVTASGGTGTGTNSGINAICYKWGQVRWVNSSSTSGSLVSVTVAASDRGMK